MGGEPVLGGLRPGRLGKEVARVRQAGGEHRGGADRVADPDRQRHAGVIDLDHRAGLVLPAHARLRGACGPGFVELGELGVAVSARVLGEVLLPQQDPRHVGLLELAMHHGPIRRGPPGRQPGDILVRGVWINTGREQARLQGALAQGLDGGKAVDPGRLCPLAIVAHRRARHPTRRADCFVAQAECQTEAQDLLDPSHLRPLPRHPFLPAKPVAEQDGMRRSQKSDTAALNPQLWRMGAKQGWRNRRNRGRIAPKHGGRIRPKSQAV